MTELVQLKKKDFESGQEVRWCPGCGDYSILASVQKLLPELGLPRENHVFVSGIGCSSRFPYYMNTYGFHTIHGRAPAIATGLKISRPELTVWVVTGDGDALSIGGNHFMHMLRRNPNLNVLLFNNRIYGLTKGQYSPTSESGKMTKSTPYGSLEEPVDPVALALGAKASFVARGLAVDAKQMASVLKEAAEHKGTSVIEIFQNCNVFNDGAFDDFADRKLRASQQVQLEHGKPVIFGDESEKGIALEGLNPKVVSADDPNVVVYDRNNINMARILGTLPFPEFPVPMGVVFQEERPCYEDLVRGQVESVSEKRGKGDLQSLLKGSDSWEVQSPQS